MRGLHIHETRRAKELRERQLKHFKFVRQAPLGPYFGDFVCREQKLVIELDGATHGTNAEILRDEKRAAYLMDQGYRVIRFTNAEVFDAADGVLETILTALERRTTV
jgi:very-short-patch-repair endonuclease